MVVKCETKGSTNGPKDLPPRTTEIVDRIEDDGGIDASKDRTSLPKDRNLKATSLETSNLFASIFTRPVEENIFHLDGEHMLKMHVPGCLSRWFNTQQYEKTQWIRKVAPRHCNKRWILIPSFRRAKIALLNWPRDTIVNQEYTVRKLVVRPSEFKEYLMYCGHKFPIICLPQDEIGAGCPRYWIQKIALRLKLQLIWMIDDSVECFYEYHPEQKSPKCQVGKNKWARNYTDYRRRKFGLVCKGIGYLVDDKA